MTNLLNLTHTTADGNVRWRRAIWVLAVEGGANACRRLSVGVTGERPASERRSGGGYYPDGSITNFRKADAEPTATIEPHDATMAYSA